jgi:ferredoxin-nitrate reductase
MSRTGKSAALTASASEPVIEMHPADAAQCDVRGGDQALVASARGEVALRVAVDDSLPPGVAFAPFHWGALHAQPGAGQVNSATNPAVDPTSRQPELKAAAIRVEALRGRRVRRGSGKGRARRLVVIGTGMAALETVEEVQRRAGGGAWRITMLGEEPGPPYNRMQLSALLAGRVGRGGLELRPAAWFAKHGIDLRGACPAATIEPQRRRRAARRAR